MRHVRAVMDASLASDRVQLARIMDVLDSTDIGAIGGRRYPRSEAASPNVDLDYQRGYVDGYAHAVKVERGSADDQPPPRCPRCEDTLAYEGKRRWVCANPDCSWAETIYADGPRRESPTQVQPKSLDAIRSPQQDLPGCPECGADLPAQRMGKASPRDPLNLDGLLVQTQHLPLLEALSLAATWENERAVAQALRGVRDPHTGALWDTCFRHTFEAVLAQPRPSKAPLAKGDEVFVRARVEATHPEVDGARVVIQHQGGWTSVHVYSRDIDERRPEGAPRETVIETIERTPHEELEALARLDEQVPVQTWMEGDAAAPNASSAPDLPRARLHLRRAFDEPELEGMLREIRAAETALRLSTEETKR